MSILPSTIGDYRIVTQLGQGGMARALLALRLGQGGFRKLFVIKQLRLDLCDDPSFIKMFLDEARLAALLNHPNVVQTHEIGEDANSHYICMEYLEGQPLSRIWTKALRQKGGVLPLTMSVQVIAQVLLGLHYTHELKDLHGEAISLVHRDISPGNIFVTYDGQVKLLDFGIAKVAGSGQTQVGVLKGKLSYMAPEQASSAELDRRTDLFAIGVMLWEAMAGRQLVPRTESQPITFQNRVNGTWESIEVVNPDAPPALVAICKKAMSVDPDDRYDTAKDMRAALLGCGVLDRERPTAESLGSFLSGLFVDERAEIDKAVAAAITTGKAVKTVGRGRSENASSSIPGYDASVSESRTLQSEDTGVDIEVISSVVGKEAPDTSKSRSRAVVVAAALAATVAVAAAGVLLLSSDTSASDKAGPSSAANAAKLASGSAPSDATPGDTSPKEPPTPPQEQEPSVVQLQIRATPASTRISLDGITLSNPYSGTRPMSADKHELLFSLDGHESQSRIIQFAQSGEWNILLLADEPTGDDESSRKRKRRKDQRLRKELEDAKLRAAQVAAKPKSDSTTKPKPRDRPRMGDDLSKKPKITPKIDRDSPYK